MNQPFSGVSLERAIPSPSVRARKSKERAGADKSSLFKTQDAKSASQKVTAPSAGFYVTALDSILFQQPSSREQKKKQIQWAKDLLDELDLLRQDMLLGKVSQQDLLVLSQLLQKNQSPIDDPQLLEIIREIEIRAAVELAKLGARI